MKDRIFTVLRYAVVIGVVLLFCKLYKWHNKAVIESTDSSMLPEYPHGSYYLTTDFQRASDLNVGDAVAFYPPGSPEGYRFGQVIAREGQRVAFVDKKVMVDDKVSSVHPNITRFSIPEIVIPHGCVFLLGRTVGEDSTKYGPIPVRNIKGKFKE